MLTKSFRGVSVGHLIREVQLSNFMSYKNASVPLDQGLNIIVGPNGAGKSSILLGISVVLGQAYTERARKLSDLIRWNEDEARVSILMDNESVKGIRMFPQARTDKVLLTRVLKRAGDYHYLLNNKPINKGDLIQGLSRVGLNPDNMLVIMHQLMVGRFGNVSPVEKLLLLEDAVGFGSYRRDVLEASTRLQRLTTERETMSSILEGTRETYQHWQREYEKYQMKMKLEDQRKQLERELIWKRIIRRETTQKRIQDRISTLNEKMEQTKQELDSSEKEQVKFSNNLTQLNQEIANYREQYLKLERGRGARSAALQWIDKFTEALRSHEKLLESLQTVRNMPPQILTNEMDMLKQKLSEVMQEQDALTRVGYTETQETTNIRETIGKLSEDLTNTIDLVVQSKVKTEVNSFKLTLMSQEIQELQVQYRLGEEELEPIRNQALQLGPVFENPRDLHDVTLELAAIEAQLRPLAHISSEVEKMFRNYGDIYEDLKKKAEVVEQNRSEVLSELHQRLNTWKDVMEKLLVQLSSSYNQLLSEVGGQGKIDLKTSKDIEKAGLELYVGFKGNEPVSLDGLAPSGGERTVALVAFLLSLQQFISSPFRAIDEFDVHMDPKNRETVSRLIHAAAKWSDATQYIAITPGQLTLPADENVHVIVVQNIEGSSLVKELNA